MVNASSIVGLLVASCAALSACSPKESKPPPDAAPSEPSAVPSAVPSARGGDEIRPAYPLEVPENPLAKRYCEALHDTPQKRKAECCSSGVGATITGECTRVLSFALNEKSVTMAPADVDRCVEALGKVYEGCAWVGPNPPRMPEACLGIIKGAVADGGVCRSSLDCAAGVFCHGAGPTNLGRCGAPHDSRFPCELAIDSLAAYTRQDNTAALHPECAGYCNRHRCFEAVQVGGPCKVTAECGPNRLCAAGKCSDGPLPTVGQPCPGAACADSARCLSGTCVAPKPEGEACSIDAECRGGCVRPDGGSKGKCGKRCGL